MDNIILLPCAFGVSAIKNKNKCCCIILNNGKTKIFNQKCEKFNKKLNVFLLRGLYFTIFNLYHLFLGLFNNVEDYNQNTTGTNKAVKSLNISKRNILVFIILISSMLISYIVLGILPIKLSFLILSNNFNIFVKRLLVGLIKILIIYFSIFALKFLPTFKQYLKFNSAIKYVQDDVKQVNFLLYFICTIFLNTIILSILALPTSFVYSFFVNLIVTALVFMINYEVFIFISKTMQIKWIIEPFNFLIVEKSIQKEIKCVNIVLKELEIGRTKDMTNKINDGQIMFSEAYVNAKEKMENADKFEKSDLDFIFCEVLGKNRAELKLLKTISKTDYKAVEKAIERRCMGEPITKIFEHANFYGLDFKVTKDVLSPRMDTEILVEQVLKDCTPKTKVLDIGTGSGAIAITLAKLGKCKVTAVDISDKALIVAKENAKNNGVTINFKKSDIFSSISKLCKFDIIVSNPPYIPSGDIATLDDEVKKFDPVLALDGGESGLDFYKRIIDESPKKLNKNGKIFFEVGINQAKDVKKLLQNFFKDIRIVKDINKIDRVVIATLK